MTLAKLQQELNHLKNPKKAKLLSSFFKTGPGQYGEGDQFLGIVVPLQRAVAKKYPNISLKDTQDLLNSKIHEYRLTALFILIKRYKNSKKEKEKEEIFNFYLNNTKNINNWDLVDLSAPNIVGSYLLDKDRLILYKLAKSNELWEKRIAILASFTFIRENHFEDALKLSEILINDKHDLIHKAVGWMLREIGKRNQEIEEEFLKKNCQKMPRTMLRYAIEKFSEEKRGFYLKRGRINF